MPSGAFDSAACEGLLIEIAQTGHGGEPALGLSVSNLDYGAFGVVIPATNYRLRIGDHIQVHGGVVQWVPQTPLGS